MQPHAHPFDRYATFTDVAMLKAFSERPLRKSIRVNTLKMSVQECERRALAKGWQLKPVPWCSEAFFVERDDREQPIGKDLLHLLGHFYIQEAASMLPAVLLQPQPHETVFDMSAAPGSKTTQMAALMQGRGVIVANDVQERRLWTLHGALHRLGVTNVIVTKKVGQWFAGHMTERFDRVLCDAPCTAQGTARKDSDALRYASAENIAKMARLQSTLLEAAVHATKVGGRIVYSTCTLTPEENEGVIAGLLNKFIDQVEIIDPRTLSIAPEGFWDQAIHDSEKVQEMGELASKRPLPCIRLWPQTYDTEGFFCAVLQKKAQTRALMAVDTIPFSERELPRSRRDDIAERMMQQYGATFLREDDRLFSRSESVVLAPKEVAWFSLPVQDDGLGLPFGKHLEDGRVLLHHELVTLRGAEATRNVLALDGRQVDSLLCGHDTDCDASARGHQILCFDGMAIGHGLAKEGHLKNNLQRWMIRS